MNTCTMCYAFWFFCTLDSYLLTVKLWQLSESCFISGAFTANDADQSSSRDQEQCKEIKQEHCPVWLEQCCTRGSFCACLFLFGLPLVQNVQTMKIF